MTMNRKTMFADTPWITRLLSTMVPIVITLGIRGIIDRRLADELDK